MLAKKNVQQPVLLATSATKKGTIVHNVFQKLTQPTAHELSLDTAFLDMMTTEPETTWNTTVTLNTKPVEFKLDTGAAVTAISEEVFKQHNYRSPPRFYPAQP